jgi:hypothetical protein
VTVADIARSKAQQWTTVNLVVVINVIMLAIAQQFYLVGVQYLWHRSWIVGLTGPVVRLVFRWFFRCSA